MAVFECRALRGELRPDGVETLEARWVAADELPQLPLSRWARALLPTLVRNRGRGWIEPVRWLPPR